MIVFYFEVLTFYLLNSIVRSVIPIQRCVCLINTDQEAVNAMHKKWRENASLAENVIRGNNQANYNTCTET
jgi:hypothetical protein